MKEKMKKIVNKLPVALITVTALLFSTVCGLVIGANINTTDYMVYEEMTAHQYEELYNVTKLELINEVDSYIKSSAKNSKLTGETLVNKCLEYDLDICFVLAQGRIESNFGTAGMAKLTNSVWNVYAFTGYSYGQISKKGKYTTPDESVDPYMQLLVNNYLVNGKTEKDMMKRFVDKSGCHYATSNKYEWTLSSQYNRIKNTTNIDSLTQELHKHEVAMLY